MGRIAQLLTKLFRRDLRNSKDAAAAFAAGLPSDLPTLEELAASLKDPQHVLYVAAQNFASAFAESVSSLREFSEYSDVVAAAEDEYLPDGPPMSPLTRSFFTTWAFFDVRFGKDRETIGNCLVELLATTKSPDMMVTTLKKFNSSRMGIYEHVGVEGKHVRLRELLTGDDFVCHCPSGYRGRVGELWYVRLCPPVAETFDYHIVMTTPYVLTGATRYDWTTFLNRSLLNEKDKRQALHDLLKFGSKAMNWLEFVFQAYHHAQYDAIFLTGLPDVAGSLPHSPIAVSASELEDVVPASPVSTLIRPAIKRENAMDSGTIVRCKFSAVQRKVIAELCPKLMAILKLDLPNQRVVEFTTSQRDHVLSVAQGAFQAGDGTRRRVLKLLIRNLKLAEPADSIGRPVAVKPRGQWVFESAPIATPTAVPPAQAMSAKDGARTVYDFRVSLCGTDPEIWRTIRIQDCSLETLHLAIQGAMGWKNSHLFQFDFGKRLFCGRPPKNHPLGWDADDDGSEDAGAVRISELVSSRHRLEMTYLYDFGDCWEHKIVLQEISTATPRDIFPQCVAGAMHCPPEDCGGVYGYFEILEALQFEDADSAPDAEYKDLQHVREMRKLYRRFDPEKFSPNTATKTMQKLLRQGMW